MKRLIPLLQIGDTVEGKVVEILAEREIIISLYGDLLRVQNETARSFKVNDSVELIVVQTGPLRFRIPTHATAAARRGGIDILS